MSIKKNILQEAEEIIFQRAQEKERDYGPINESMEKASEIASLLSGKDFTPRMMYIAMIAIKLSRISHKYKRDNYLDAIGYMGALAEWEDYIDKVNNKSVNKKIEYNEDETE